MEAGGKGQKDSKAIGTQEDQEPVTLSENVQEEEDLAVTEVETQAREESEEEPREQVTAESDQVADANPGPEPGIDESEDPDEELDHRDDASFGGYYDPSYEPAGIGVGAEDEEEEEEEVIEPGPGSIDEYVAGIDEAMGAIVVGLCEIIREAAPNAEESIKWGMPHYAQSGHLAYIDAKQDHVNLGFFRGDELADHEDARSLFQGAGGKLRHIRLYSVHSIPNDAIRSLMLAAVALNRDISGL